MKVRILHANSPGQIETVRKLFREYEKELQLDLCFQGFEEELQNLPGKYAKPEGRIYIAYKEGKSAGCIAMRKLEDGICEMKRLFVRDEYKGLSIGRALVEKLIGEAEFEGYSKMRLDTFPPKMAKAVNLYTAYGFREIAPYYDNPHEGAIFMELELYPIPWPKVPLPPYISGEGGAL